SASRAAPTVTAPLALQIEQLQRAPRSGSATVTSKRTVPQWHAPARGAAGAWAGFVWSCDSIGFFPFGVAADAIGNRAGPGATSGPSGLCSAPAAIFPLLGSPRVQEAR